MFLVRRRPDGFIEDPDASGEGKLMYMMSRGLTQLKDECNSDVVCFVSIAGKLALGEVSIGEYFDLLLNHLREDGSRHTFDTNDAPFEHLLRADLIGGAVKWAMLDQHFPRLPHNDATKLKQLCVVTYHSEDGEHLQREAEAAGCPLPSLPPSWANILAMVAYARRQPAVFQTVLSSTASSQSVFDVMPSSVLASRISRTEPDGEFQHSPPSPTSQEQEWAMWDALLNSPWIHHPISKDLKWGMNLLITGWERQPDLRASPTLRPYLDRMKSRDIIPQPRTAGSFLSIWDGSMPMLWKTIKPCTLDQACMFLSVFPVSEILSAWPEQGSGAVLALPITQWPTDNPDRLEVMRMLLDSGVDPNDRQRSWGPGTWPCDTLLHKAAERGDLPMVDLLLENGADKDLLGASGDTPTKRAEVGGHDEIVRRLAAA